MNTRGKFGSSRVPPRYSIQMSIQGLFIVHISFSIELKHRCNAPCLLIATEDRILVLDYARNSSFTVISNLSHGVVIDVHYNLGYIFWSDATERNIKRSNMDGRNIAVILNNTDCDGLAVDWHSLRLYWTDLTNDTISVSDFEGNNKRIMFSSELDRPTGIVLDVQEG